MVGDDHVDVPGQDGLPEELLVVLVSDWRTALVLGGSGRDLVRGEVEVVVASLHGQTETLGSSSSDKREGGGGREVDDVTGNSSVAANIHHQLGQRAQVSSIACVMTMTMNQELEDTSALTWIAAVSIPGGREARKVE